ncbi:MAG: hemolysin family protein [Candidatus Rifleibacteriota bacterium]
MLETLIFFVVLLFTSALFSGTETAFTSLNEIRLMNEKGKGSVKILKEMVRNKRNVIAAILVGNNIVNTVLAVYAGAFFDDILVNSGMLSEKMGPLFASIVTVIFLLIFGEVIPKHIGVTFTRAWMKIVSLPLWLVVRILKPVTSAMDAFSHLMMSLLPFKTEEGESPNIQELMIMAKYSANAGHIDEIERKLVVRATRFNDLEANDVMIPRRQVVGVAEDVSFEELQEVFRKYMLSRIPVFSGAIDTVAGIFNFKELLNLKEKDLQNFNILDYCHEPLFVPESVSIGILFDQMKLKKTHMAIVVDEFGATAGIITLEDIIERIFGLIHDEYDEESIRTIEKISENEYEVKGRTALEDIEVALDMKFPEDINRQVNTVNGLITLLKGDFAQKRDEIPYKNLIFKVEKIKGMRAAKIRVFVRKK